MEGGELRPGWGRCTPTYQVAQEGRHLLWWGSTWIKSTRQWCSDLRSGVFQTSQKNFLQKTNKKLIAQHTTSTIAMAGTVRHTPWQRQYDTHHGRDSMTHNTHRDDRDLPSVGSLADIAVPNFTRSSAHVAMLDPWTEGRGYCHTCA